MANAKASMDIHPEVAEAVKAGRPVVVVSLVDERVLLVRDAWDVSSRFTIVVVVGPVAPTCAREGRVDGV